MADKAAFSRASSRTEDRRRPSGFVVVRSFDTGSAAQEAVDNLADRGFPVERLAVVARDLVMVEQVTGRRTLWQAIVEGAWAGAFVGAALGFFFGLSEWVEPLVSALVLALWGVVLGTVVGAVVGGAGHWALGDGRNFTSVKGWEAGGFDLVTDASTATEVSALLSRRPERAASRSR